MPVACGFIILLTALFALTLYRCFKLERCLGKIAAALDEILGGNSNRRIFAGEQGKIIKHLVYRLNMLVSAYQSMIQKSRYADETRKKMISDISHDIRTPLTSIQGYMEALKIDIGLSTEEREEYIDIVVRKCRSLNDLVQSFFEISRLEEADTSIYLDKVDINARVRFAMSCFYNDFENMGIIPEIMLPACPIFAYANCSALDRVLQNLISNTLFYGKDGGFFGISAEESPDRVFVNIWDKGKGISEEDMNHVFERSYNISQTANGKLQAGGLGLAIARKLIEKQNGEISVNSIPGVKTVFSFSLQRYQ